MSYVGKRYALIFGTSIEGVGVTRSGIEMKHWCEKNGIELTVYSYDEIKFVNKAAQKFDYVSFTKDDINEITKELNAYDAVIFNSYPLHKMDKLAIKLFYENLVKKVEVTKIGFMHDVKKNSIEKIPYIVGIMNQMDLIYSFNTETWFGQNVPATLPSKVKGERIKSYKLWMNYDLMDVLRDEYTLDKKVKKMLYLGRHASHKDTTRVLEIGDIMREVDPTFQIEMRGLYRSIDVKFAIIDHPVTIDCTGKVAKPNERGFVPVYGPYEREEGMRMMAESLFGCSFFSLPKEPLDYGDKMEYIQMEMIAVGALPVFCKHWGENNRTRSGQRFIDIPNFGIWSDRNDLRATVDQLIEVANSPELQQKIRETSYAVAKSEYDANIVLDQIFTEIDSVTPDNNRYATDKELMEAVSGSEEFAKAAQELLDQGENVFLNFKELQTASLTILEDKKKKHIKKFKVRK